MFVAHAHQCRPPAPKITRCSTTRSSADRAIRDFLSGKNDGEQLLHAIYDHVLDEPVPERLKALLKR
jgi:hypothetical protein